MGNIYYIDIEPFMLKCLPTKMAGFGEFGFSRRNLVK